MIVLHYDVTSASSVVAALRLQRIADEGLQVTFAGIDVLGLAISVPVTPEMAAEMHANRPAAAALGLPLRSPSRRPPTLGCHSLGSVAEQVGVGASWRKAVFTAYWHHDADLADDAVLVSLAGEAGLDTGQVSAHLADLAGRRAESARMAAQRRRGIGGVPVLEVGGVFTSAELGEDDLRRLAAL